MDIGKYSFNQFKELATQFHGYPAPGLLIGGYMVELAKTYLPKNCLFEAIVETKKCLPDAVQLLTLCSIGNNWLKINNLGRYAVSLFDKYTGLGIRVAIDTEKLDFFPEIKAWFLKTKTKAEQDSNKLLAEIEEAGSSLCKVEVIQIKPQFLGHKKMQALNICPICNEAYPYSDGEVCRACQGDGPYLREYTYDKPQIEIIDLQESIGKKTAHDMTKVEKDIFKGVAFKKGHTIQEIDLCQLQKMGRYNIAVENIENESSDFFHENEAALLLARKICGSNITFSNEVKEGKISFIAQKFGLLNINSDMLIAINSIQDIILVTQKQAKLVNIGSEVAAVRAIPLYTHIEKINQALTIIKKPVINILPLKKAKTAIIVTGTEVFNGLVEDKFIPIISAKIIELGSEIVFTCIVPDKKTNLLNAITQAKNAGANLIITTAGLSVDPDDITRETLITAGLTNILYGLPILPGAMSLIGKIDNIDVIGVPACALYHKITAFDILLPQVLAGLEITRQDLSKLAMGGLCHNCKTCSYPHCSFC